jgi:hypothetical protein
VLLPPSSPVLPPLLLLPLDPEPPAPLEPDEDAPDEPPEPDAPLDPPEDDPLPPSVGLDCPPTLPPHDAAATNVVQHDKVRTREKAMV